MRLSAVLLALLLLTGCGPGLTRTMWTAPLPDTPPHANRASRIGHRVGRVVVVVGKTVATPVTVVADVAGAAVASESVGEILFNVIGAVFQAALRANCR